jgi:hypothetical protein
MYVMVKSGKVCILTLSEDLQVCRDWRHPDM